MPVFVLRPFLCRPWGQISSQGQCSLLLRGRCFNFVPKYNTQSMGIAALSLKSCLVFGLGSMTMNFGRESPHLDSYSYTWIAFYCRTFKEDWRSISNTTDSEARYKRHGDKWPWELRERRGHILLRESEANVKSTSFELRQDLCSNSSSALTHSVTVIKWLSFLSPQCEEWTHLEDLWGRLNELVDAKGSA